MQSKSSGRSSSKLKGKKTVELASKETKYKRNRDAETVFGAEGSSVELQHELRIRKNATGTYSVFSLKYSPDGTLLAAGCSDGRIRIYNNIGELEGTLASTTAGPDEPSSLQYMSVRWRPVDSDSGTNASKNVLLACSADGSIEHWHVSSRKRIHTMQDTCEIYCSDFNSSGSCFATGGSDATIKIWDEYERVHISSLSAHRAFEYKGTGAVSGEQAGHGNRIFSLQYHPEDSNIIVSGGWDRSVYIWDLRSGHAERNIFGPQIAGDSVSVKGQQILTGAHRIQDPLELWDLGSGGLIEKVPWFNSASSQNPCKLYAAQLSPSISQERLIAAGGCGGENATAARVFDQKKQNVRVGVVDVSNGVTSLDFDPSGRKLAFGSADGTIVVVRIVNL